MPKRLTKQPVKKVVRQSPTLSWSCERLERWVDRNLGDYEERDFIFEIEEFPGCCAFSIVHGFDLPNSLLLEEAQALLCRRLTGQGLILATTVPSQRNVISVLEAVGFKAIKTVTNPNTGNRVTMWLGNAR